MSRLGRAFFARDCIEVARDLLGCVLVRVEPDGRRLSGRLVEVEAYLGQGRDPASHAYGGETARNRSMFGPPGRLYAYRSYGIHTCLNLVCEPAGSGAAVLLRALEPLSGLETMRARRGLPAGGPALPAVASGPGRLAQALGLGLRHDGMSALGPALYLREPAPGDRPLALGCGPRVGIARAAARPYRFWVDGSPFVSRWRAGRAPRASREAEQQGGAVRCGSPRERDHAQQHRRGAGRRPTRTAVQRSGR